MKLAYGAIMIIFAIMLGIYFGLWICIIGGFAQIIYEVTMSNITSIGGVLNIVFGVMKICVGIIAIWTSVYIFVIPGCQIAKE